MNNSKMILANQRLDRYYESKISAGEPPRILGDTRNKIGMSPISNKPDGKTENLGNPALSNAVPHGSPVATGISYIKAATLAAEAVRALKSRGIDDPTEDDLHTEMTKSLSPQKTPKGYMRVFGHYKPIREASVEKEIFDHSPKKVKIPKISMKSPGLAATGLATQLAGEQYGKITSQNPHTRDNPVATGMRVGVKTFGSTITGAGIGGKTGAAIGAAIGGAKAIKDEFDVRKKYRDRREQKNRQEEKI